MAFVNGESVWGGKGGGGAYEHDHNELYYLKEEVDVEVAAIKQKNTSQDTAIGKKADLTHVNTELGKKANTTHAHDNYTLKTETDSKAEKVYVDTELGKKADKTHTHTTYATKAEVQALQNTITALEARVLALETPNE